MWRDRLALAVGAMLALAAAPQTPSKPPDVLPAAATAQLTRNLSAAKSQKSNVWRDSPLSNPEGTINGYVEIARGDRRKWEFDVGRNARVIDRVMPPSVGAYPVNYGFVPQTVSYDGDPFDILVLGPPISGGTVVRGLIVGLMHMTDEKGLDSKVVVSPVAKNGSAIHALTPDDQERIGDYFKRYKLGEPGKFSTVPGWGSATDGRAYVDVTHAFFRDCRTSQGECALPSRTKAPAVKDF
jgi:inorganic pyrophosphatase